MAMHSESSEAAVDSDDDLDWPNFSENDSDFDAGFVPETTGDHFTKYMLKLFDERTLNAKQLCIAMRLANRAGIAEA